ncbi:cytochrome c oxidase assembly protein [Arthrobacter crystallopoietes]|uniref:Cytochrome c oxidase caa3 assembly factor (Caa3_CtaG) n=1 Tax=Crystallibacter crystallopoietes TaxID=37928 RepID=A0A1H0XKI8_9MICC|nr:cytochrome c oxidase assembly protein [Arthrobacter crystallopoietes]SDQ03126.1 Cytochrome c oxidase caa3 assembly factor (Caa3_CtaG) [Arthrobacter crystallopoietes]
MSDVDAILPFFPDWFRFDPAGASPIVAGAALLLCALYLRGVIWMWSQGRRWSVARTIAFVLGCALMFMVATFGVNRYASVSLTALMFQQITLMTVVPPLIIVGSPGRLLLHSTPHHGIGRIVLQAAHGGLRSRWARALLHPVTPIVIALALFPALYLTDFISIAMMTPVGADLILAVFLVGGLVAGVPLWSVDPLPRAPSYPARLIDILVELQIHAVLGLILIRSGAPLISAYATSQQGGDPVYDQAVAGMLLWTYAELPLFVVLIVCLSRWHSGDRRNARLNETREDAELEAYNTYLSEIDHKGGR